MDSSFRPAPRSPRPSPTSAASSTGCAHPPSTTSGCSRRSSSRSTGPEQAAFEPLATYQYATGLGSEAEAARLVDTIKAWPEGCAARTGDEVTSSSVRSGELPDGQVGYWYTHTVVQGGGVQDDGLVAVTQAGDRVTVIVLHEYDGSTNIDRVDATELLTRALDRLG